MPLGSNADIWPLSLGVMKRACWNNYRTWGVRVGAGPRSAQWRGTWHGTAFTGVKSEGSGGKVQEEERGQRRDEGRWGLLSALVVIWWGQGANAPTQSRLVLKKSSRWSEEENRLQINKLLRLFSIFLSSARFTNEPLSLCNDSDPLNVYTCVLSCICPSLVQNFGQPPRCPSFHGGILGAAART